MNQQEYKQNLSIWETWNLMHLAQVLIYIAVFLWVLHQIYQLASISRLWFFSWTQVFGDSVVISFHLIFVFGYIRAINNRFKTQKEKNFSIFALIWFLIIWYAYLYAWPNFFHLNVFVKDYYRLQLIVFLTVWSFLMKTFGDFTLSKVLSEFLKSMIEKFAEFIPALIISLLIFLFLPISDEVVAQQQWCFMTSDDSIGSVRYMNDRFIFWDDWEVIPIDEVKIFSTTCMCPTKNTP